LRGDSPGHETVAGFFTPAIKQEDSSKKGKNMNTLVVVGYALFYMIMSAC
jgi:hypothetical protein